MHKIHILVLIGPGLTRAQHTQHPVKLVEARVVERQGTAALLGFQGDAQPESCAQLALERHGVSITRAPFYGWWRFRTALDEPLGGADVEPAAHDLLGQCDRVRRAEQSARMAGGELALVEPAAHRRRQRQQPHRVCDMTATFAESLGEARLGAGEFFDQPALGLRLIQR